MGARRDLAEGLQGPSGDQVAPADPAGGQVAAQDHVAHRLAADREAYCGLGGREGQAGRLLGGIHGRGLPGLVPAPTVRRGRRV